MCSNTSAFKLAIMQGYSLSSFKGSSSQSSIFLFCLPFVFPSEKSPKKSRNLATLRRRISRRLLLRRIFCSMAIGYRLAAARQLLMQKMQQNMQKNFIFKIKLFRLFLDLDVF